jgi:hypothetical protein
VPSSRPVKIEFPLSGENRSGGYSKRTAPYSTPRAVNVRSVGPLEGRGRGGSRPGLSKLVSTDFGSVITGLSSVTYLTSAGAHKHVLAVICDGNLFVVDGSTVTQMYAYLTTDDGNYVITDDGDRIIFNATVASVNPIGDNNSFQMAESNGKLYIADSVLKRYNPLTGVVENVTGAPASQPLVCVYQHRVVLSGADHMFYACAVGDDTDWSFAKDMGNPGRAFAGHLGGNTIGEPIKAMVQYEDKALVLATNDGVWVIYGNFAGEGGRRACISPRIGVISPGGIAVAPGGTALMLARDGLYSFVIGSDAPPQPFSDKAVPDDFLDIDPTTVTITMQYDYRSRGFHLFLTPDHGVGTHWWIDIVNHAMWPVKLSDDHQPLCACELKTSGFSNIILGCSDGYLRRFDDEAEDDDGTDVQSDLFLGPFHTSREEGYEGQITEIVGALAAESGEVTWRIVVGDSAEEAVDAADAALNGDRTTGVDSSGTWSAGQNRVEYPRARGAWVVIWLSSTKPWAFESMTAWMKKLGRIR